MSARIEVTSAVLTRGSLRVLDGVDLTARAGDFIGVIGPNGAGKSSLLRLFAGLEPPTGGSVRLDGRDLHPMPAGERARRLAYLPQARPLYAAITVDAVVALGRFAYGSTMRLDAAGRAAVDRAKAATDIAAFGTRVATTLSGGELARTHLARALAAETPVLILDEPIAALDPRHQLRILAHLRDKAAAGGLVVAALHEIGLARRFCTRIVGLKNGRVTTDAAPEALGGLGALYDLEPLETQMFWGG